MNFRPLSTLPLAFCFSLTASFIAHAEFAFKDSAAEGQLDVLNDGKVIARYMYANDLSTKERTFDTAKTYLHVFDAEGKAPITKGPGGNFPHHRGIFVGWNKLTVDGKQDDLWHMPGTRQLHRKFSGEKSGKDSASVTSEVSWVDKAGKPLIEEKRTMTFLDAPEPAYEMIDVNTTLKAVAGDTLFNGDPEHSGLQFRAANEVKAEKTMYLFPKEKADPHKDLDYTWVGESYVLGDKTYSVIYLNHPKNPTKTRFSAYRDYGRFGGFFTTSLKKDEELNLQVRFLIIEGEMPSAKWIQEQSNRFTGESLPTPQTTSRVDKPAPPKPAPAPVKDAVPSAGKQ